MQPALDDSLSPEQLHRICTLVQGASGIHLTAEKQALVRSRLRRRLVELGLGGFGAYLRRLQADPTGREIEALTEALATHTTGFLREPEHFAFLRDRFLPELRARGGSERLRLWSAGCATGEEAYSLSMVAHDARPLPEAQDIGILATDLSRRALAVARRGVYATERVEALPEPMRSRWIEPVASPRGPAWRVKAEARRAVRFARLNLIGPWPMRGPFDAIFCRNVMIYFERPLQQSLVGRFRTLLRPGGLLVLGHAESLAAERAGWRYEGPSLYRRA